MNNLPQLHARPAFAPICLALNCVALACFALALGGCGSSGSNATPSASKSHATASSNSSPVAATTNSAAPQASDQKGPASDKSPPLEPLVVIETSLGPITVKLFPEKAPQTVDNFLDNYVARGYYDRTIVHYVEKDFIVSAGAFTAEGQPKEPRSEIRNEAANGLKNARGTLAMARNPEHVHSATSQFFFNLKDNPELDHRGYGDDEYGYCVFGEVVKGLDVLDRIGQAPVKDEGELVNRPVETVVLESVRRIR